jgi:hypothetical protein
MVNSTVSMKRRTGFGLSMLLMGLWWGQSALFQSGSISLVMGMSAVTLIGFSGGVLSGAVKPGAIPEEEMSPLASYCLVAMLIVGSISLLLIVLLVYI